MMLGVTKYGTLEGGEGDRDKRIWLKKVSL